MIKEAIGTGSSVAEATEKAKAALNAPEEIDVKFEVLDNGKERFLGLFGGSPAKVKAYYEIEDDKFAKVKDYLTVILANLGIEQPEITVDADGEDCRISIQCGDDYGSVIGRRGETLDAIQYLTRLVVNRECGDFKHVSINVGNYREKREATLTALAKKNAARVKKYGRRVVLEPMNPYERRVIHTAIQEIEGVTSHSVGSDDDRKVVIELEEGFKPENGGSNYGRRGGYNRGGYRRSKPEFVSSAPTREARSDAEGPFSYGKIEVNK